MLLVQSPQIRLMQWTLMNWVIPKITSMDPTGTSQPQPPEWFLLIFDWSREPSAGSTQPYLGPAWLRSLGDSQLAVHADSPGWAWPHANVHLTLYTVDVLDPTDSTAIEFTHCSIVHLCWCCFSYSCLSFCYYTLDFLGQFSNYLTFIQRVPVCLYCCCCCSLLWNITYKCPWIPLLFN